MRLILPEAPSSNRFYRKWRGHMVIGPAGRAYMALAATLTDLEPFPRGIALKVSIDWHRSARRGDLDNRAKITIDALKGVCYVDDDQIVELHMRRFEDKHNARMEVTVEAA